MTTAPEQPAIPHAEVASTHPTTEDGFTPPGVTDQMVEIDAADQVEALSGFLDIHFPGEQQRTNRQVPELPTETAMRLLLGLSGRANLSAVTRCPEAYCNKNENHTDVHGMVHYG